MSEQEFNFSAMRCGVTYRFKVPFKDGFVWLRPLANEEIIEATGECASRLSKMTEFERNRIAENVILARIYLSKASREYGKTEGGVTEHQLAKLSNEELLFLYGEWIAVCEKVNPKVEDIPKEEVMRLVEEAKKNPSDLMDFSIHQLAAMVHSFLVESKA